MRITRFSFECHNDNISFNLYEVNYFWFWYFEITISLKFLLSSLIFCIVAELYVQSINWHLTWRIIEVYTFYICWNDCLFILWPASSVLLNKVYTNTNNWYWWPEEKPVVAVPLFDSKSNTRSWRGWSWLLIKTGIA